MTEVEIREKAQLNTYKNTSMEDRKRMQLRESLVTGITAMNSKEKFLSNAANLNPMALLDGVNLAATTFQSYIDQAYDYSGDDVPHYLKQETRGLLYTDE